MNRLTWKQEETIRKIVEYERSHNGIGPTANDLTGILGLNSPQAAINRLRKLEQLNYIRAEGDPRRFHTTRLLSLMRDEAALGPRVRPSEEHQAQQRTLPPNVLYNEYSYIIDRLLVPDVHIEELQTIQQLYVTPIESDGPKAIHLPHGSAYLVDQDRREVTQQQFRTLSGLERKFVNELLQGRNLIVLRGDPGRGKSMFVRVLFEERLPQIEFFRNHISIILDGQKIVSIQYALSYKRLINVLTPILESRLWQAITKAGISLKSVVEFILEERGYSKDDGENIGIQMTRPGIKSWTEQEWYGDRLRLAILLVKFIRQLPKGPWQLVLVIDNIDQFPFQTQIEMLRFVSSFSSETDCKCVLVMRKVTYSVLMDMRNKGLLKSVLAYGALVFSVIEQTTPRLSEVLDKRIQALTKILPKYIRVPSHNKTFVVKAESMWKTIRNTLLRDDIADFLHGFCGGDVKMSMLLAERFFSSAFLDWEEFSRKIILTGSDKDWNFSMISNIDQFIRCILLNNRELFAETKAEKCVENLYSHPQRGMMFPSIIKYYTLKLIAHHSDRVSVKKIVDEMATYGMDKDAVRSTIERFVFRQLVTEYPVVFDRDAALSEQPRTESFDVEINDRGRFYVEKLYCRLEYLQHMADDAQFYAHLVDKFDKRSFSYFPARLKNTLLLIDQIFLEDLRCRLNLIETSFALYERFVMIFGRDLVSIKLLEHLLSEFVDPRVDTFFGRKHRLNRWQRIIRYQLRKYREGNAELFANE